MFPLLLGAAAAYSMYRFLQDLGGHGQLGEGFIASGKATEAWTPWDIFKGRVLDEGLESIYKRNLDLTNQLAVQESTSLRGPDGEVLNRATRLNIALVKNERNINQIKIDDRHFVGRLSRENLFSILGWVGISGVSGWGAAMVSSIFLGPLPALFIGLLTGVVMAVTGSTHLTLSSKLPLVRMLLGLKTQAVTGQIVGTVYEPIANYVLSRVPSGVNWQTALQTLDIEAFITQNHAEVNKYFQEILTNATNQVSAEYKTTFKNVPLSQEVIGFGQWTANKLSGLIA